MHQAEWNPSPAMPSIHEKQTGHAMQHITAAIKYLGERLPLALGFFLLSLAECLSVPSPYAISFLAALLAAGQKPRGALGGLAVGLGFRILWGLPWDIWQFAACLLCYAVLKNPPEKTGQLLVLTGALLLLRALPDMIAARTSLTVILHAAGLLIGVFLVPAFRHGAQIMNAKQWKLSVDDALCLSLPVLLMLSGAGRLMALSVNVGYLAAVYASISMSWLCGGAVGVCAGVGCGMALLLGGQGALPLVNLTLGTIMAGLFQGKNRMISAGIFVLTSLTVTYLSAHGFSPTLLICALLGSLLFCLTPGSWLNKASVLMQRLRWNKPRENAYMRLNMQRWAQAIDRIADALPSPRMETENTTEDREKLRAWLCEDCNQKSVCIYNFQTEVRERFGILASLTDDPDTQLDQINRLFSSCIRIGAIPSLLKRLETEQMNRTQKALCAAYERDMLHAHLTALSQAAQQISLEDMNDEDQEAYWLQQAEETLHSMRFPGHAAFVKQVNGRMAVCIRCEPLSLRPQVNEALEKRLGLQLHTDLIVTEQSGDRILLEEPAPLRIITGVATINAASREPVSLPQDNGDAVLVQPLSNGRELLAISDGMGHGTDAQAESRKTLEMLSLCMDAGYSRSQAMTVVNGSMLSVTGGEKFATVDLCLIDLWTGETAMNKLGAAASYLIQGQKIKAIEGAALPLGIIEHVIPMEHRFSMGEGDTLVLVSDGIADAFEHEEILLNILKKRRGCTPQRLADTILRAAMDQWDGVPPDDMTVLCARVEEREKSA